MKKDRHRSKRQEANKGKNKDQLLDEAKTIDKKNEMIKRLKFKDIVEMSIEKEKQLSLHYKNNSYYALHMLLRYQIYQLSPSYIKPAIATVTQHKNDGDNKKLLLKKGGNKNKKLKHKLLTASVSVPVGRSSERTEVLPVKNMIHGRLSAIMI